MRPSSPPSVSSGALLSRVASARSSVEHAGEHARPDHRRRKPRALLIGPGDDLDRGLGLVAEIVQRAHDFQPRHHAIGAVEAAAGRLRVEMAAGHDRRQPGIASRTTREDVADPVHRDRAAGLLAPAYEQAARLGVEIARREPADAALFGGADLRQFHQAGPQPLAIDLQIPHPRPPPIPDYSSIASATPTTRTSPGLPPARRYAALSIARRLLHPRWRP